MSALMPSRGKVQTDLDFLRQQEEMQADLNFLGRCDLAYQEDNERQIPLRVQIDLAMENPESLGNKIIQIIDRLTPNTVVWLQSRDALFKTVPCRNLKKRPPYCKFTSECRFAHTLPVFMLTMIAKTGVRRYRAKEHSHENKCFMDSRICIFLHPETRQLHLPNIEAIQGLLQSKFVDYQTQKLIQRHLLSERLCQNLTVWNPLTSRPHPDTEKKSDSSQSSS